MRQGIGCSLIGRGRRAMAFCQTEIQQFGAVFRQHDVARLQISMYYAGAMRSIQRIGDLNAVSQNIR